MQDNKIHLIGNAHLDPVFLWSLPDGLSEIKATFRSALDRIKEFDDFIFTSAAISYYAWVEENCPEMFEEIKEAVKAGKWNITGAMWVQPDCNLISSESFARHLLYSQKFVRERFGITVKTGYNVDSFGHTASLPKLLNEGGVENYVYMRPSDGEEKKYPFDGSTFLWKYADGEVLTFRIQGGYGTNITDDTPLKEFEEKADNADGDIMMFYGVGNHGGGPTIKNIKTVKEYAAHSKHEFFFSCPDVFFDAVRKNGVSYPSYTGDLQNHASGCYSANSYMKSANSFAETRLAETEKWLTMAHELVGRENRASFTEEAWKGVLFNQFHDVMCGCSVKSSFDDAKGDFEFARSVGFKLKSRSLQAVSWAVDTQKGITSLSKECDWLWEYNDLGTPVVVFNPLPYEVTVPVRVRKPRYCAGITYVENGTEIPLPFQEVRGDITEHDYKTVFLFNAPLPAFGYRTFWVYAQNAHPAEAKNTANAEPYSLENNVLRMEFDPESGDVISLTDKRSGREHIGGCACRPLLIDDTKNDTWAHGNFVFNDVIGEFANPVFTVLESGGCIAKLKVTRTSGANRIEQVFSLCPDDSFVHVTVKLFIADELRMVKLAFKPNCEIKTATYGCAGGIIEKPADGREQPMQRFVTVTDGNGGLAVCTKDKYSASADSEKFAFVAVRTCYFADHVGERDGRLEPQDLGPHEFEYTVSPFTGDFAELEKTSARLHAEFPLINETYHKGTLAQSASLMSVSEPNVAVDAIKAAEDGNGLIFRLRETAGIKTSAVITWQGNEYTAQLSPHDIASFRLPADRRSFLRSDFLED